MISMTLDDLERLNRGFMDIFGDFGLRDTFEITNHKRWYYSAAHWHTVSM